MAAATANRTDRERAFMAWHKQSVARAVSRDRGAAERDVGDSCRLAGKPSAAISLGRKGRLCNQITCLLQ
jgi:hypothetical protein